MRLLKFGVALLIAALAAGARPAAASTINVDELGNGFFNGNPLAFVVAPDPGPGGLPAVLTYLLPFAGTQARHH